MNDRKDLFELINEIESSYSVNKWVHNDYYIWPILRIFVYMNLVNSIENVQSDKNTETDSFISKISGLIRSIKKNLSIDEKNISKLYISASNHCVNYDGYIYNKYIDTLMDESDDKSLYLNKLKGNVKNLYKPERQLSYSDLLLGYKAYNKIFKSSLKSSPYIKKLFNILGELGVVIEDFEYKASIFLKKVDLSIVLSQRILKKLKPNEIYVLCYYSADIIGVLIAADKLSIPTIDLQHGGQGGNHLAYSSWSNIPLEGYEALPNFFYTWDEASTQNIEVWAKDTAKHKARKFRNPWVEGWKQNKFRQSDYHWPEDIILYTLQPTGEPLEEYILETINNTKHKWNWWLRLHPRQMKQRDKITSRLKEYGLDKIVNIEEATTLPLPEILTHTSVHITKFSGCALEAYEFDVPTIIIDKRGIDCYKQYITNHDMMFSLLSKCSEEMKKKIQSLYKKF